jgi:hypothetical protein
MIAIHISNRHLQLRGTVSAVGAAEGLVTYGKVDENANDFLVNYRANAHVVALARSEADLGTLPRTEGWRKARPDPVAWTDDFSDVLRLLIRSKLYQ